MWRYCLVPADDVTQEMAELGHYTSPEYMRQSKDGYMLVKWKGNKPHCLHDREEITDIVEELSKARWQDVE